MFGKLRRFEKSWGHELWLHNSPLYCGKVLVIRPGQQLSYHYHAEKHETFALIEGRCMLFLGERAPAPASHDGCDNWESWAARGEWHVLEPGTTVEIQPYVVHSLRALDEVVRVMEVSTQHFDSDSYRLSRSRDGA